MHSTGPAILQPLSGLTPAFGVNVSAWVLVVLLFSSAIWGQKVAGSIGQGPALIENVVSSESHKARAAAYTQNRTRGSIFVKPVQRSA